MGKSDPGRRNEWLVLAGVAVTCLTLIAVLTTTWRHAIIGCAIALPVLTFLFVLHGSGPVQIFLGEHGISRQQRRARRNFHAFRSLYTPRSDGSHAFVLTVPTVMKFEGAEVVERQPSRDYGEAVSCRLVAPGGVSECASVRQLSDWVFMAVFPTDFEVLPQTGKQRVEWLVEGELAAVERVRVHDNGSVHQTLYKRLDSHWYSFRHHYWPNGAQ